MLIFFYRGVYLDINEFYEESKKYVIKKIENLNHKLIIGPRIVLFLIPCNACSYDTNFNVNVSITGNFNPICSRDGRIAQISNHVFTFGGPGPQNDNGHFCYAVINDKGIIESADRRSLNFEKKELNLKYFINNFKSCFMEYIDIYSSLKIDYPVFISVSLFKMKGFRLLAEEGPELKNNTESIFGLIPAEAEAEHQISMIRDRIIEKFYNPSNLI